jgi:putative NIF3 family GTP cyclohydrolase 1 type 2
VVHQLIRAGIALLVAHTNADVAEPGVSGALAGVLDLRDTRPLLPGTDGSAGRPPAGIGRVGDLPEPMTLAELASYVAARLPATTSGVRAAGDPDRRVTTLAVMGGAGDTHLRDAAAAGVDAYLTADLRHHPASEHLAEAGPALLDAAHWATERPWLDLLAVELAADLPVDVHVSDFVTDVWRVHAPSPDLKEPSP